MSEDQKDFTKLGIVYASILIIFCNVIAVDWQSDQIFYVVGIYPYGLGVIYWPVVGYLLGSRSLHRFRFLRQGCLSVSAFYTYNVVGNVVSDGGGEDFVWQLWRQSALQAVLLVAYLLSGQVTVSCMLWRKAMPGQAAI